MSGESHLSHNTWVFGPNNSAFCSGWNEHGQLGFGNTTDVKAFQPFAAPPGDKIASVACGYNHTIMVTGSGKVYGMGSNERGQLGQPPQPKITGPTPISISGHCVAAACGSDHSLVLTQDGKLYAMGSNEFGQLGIGKSSAQNMTVPVQVHSLAHLKVTKIQAGFHHSFAFTSDGQIWVFGKNDMGQLGLRNLRPEVFDPTPMNSGINVKFLATGDTHTFLVSDTNQIYGVGYFHREFDYGQVPQRIGGFTEQIIGFVGGVFHCLVLTASKGLYGYGQNGYKQIGTSNGPNIKTFERVNLPVNGTIKSIASGYHHSMAILEDGKLLTWGAQSRGQTGTGENSNIVLPSVVQIGSTITHAFRVPARPAVAMIVEEKAEDTEVALPFRPTKAGSDKDQIIRELQAKNAEQAALIQRLEAEVASLKAQVVYQKTEAMTLQDVGAMNISFMKN